MRIIIRIGILDIFNSNKLQKQNICFKYLQYFPNGFEWNILYFTLDITAKFTITCFRGNPNNAKFISFHWYWYKEFGEVLDSVLLQEKSLFLFKLFYWCFRLKGAKHRLFFHGFTCDWIIDLRIRFNMKVILIRLDIAIQFWW